MTYWTFLLPIIAGIVAQLIKIIIELARGTFSWHVVKKYGGMPSAHAAFIFGLLTEVAITDGLASTTFAIALIVTILIIRDATGYRRDMDKHARAINTLSALLPTAQQTRLDHFDDTIGHTPWQAAAGALVGILTIIIGHFLLF
ncbi:divergent PAP2 family protein [Candidatus Falkowbacteria bacterium]|nr:divergent PAP2 family protein [Candidatus Falkowbacteria bacterium]